MIYCAGIDGGQSASTCVLGDETGVVLARIAGPPADLVGESRTSPRQAGVLDELLRAVLAAAKLPAKTPLAALVAGLSGFDAPEAREPVLRSSCARFRAVHDAESAQAGAFDGAPGIVLIAGTGSVAFGVGRDGRRLRVGGWGYAFGDEGSGYWIARRAIARAMHDEDAGRPGTLGARVLRHFGLGSLRALQHAAAHKEISRPQIAALARVVLEAAREGDAAALEIRAEAATALAGLVHLAHRRLGGGRDLPIATAGSLFGDRDLLERWKWRLREYDPAATIVKASHDPAFGALRLAYRDAGLGSPILRNAGQ